MKVTVLLYSLQRFGLGIGLFKRGLSKLPQLKKQLICTSQEFTLLYVNQLLH